MTITSRTLDTLEFHKILARLAEHTSFSASHELALSLRPDEDPSAIIRSQRATTAGRFLFENRPEVSIGGARDIRTAVALARRGGVLETLVLLEVSGTLAAMRQLRASLLNLQDDVYAPFRDLAPALPTLPQIEAAIDRAIDPSGEVLDSASPALGKIRSQIRIAHARLMERLQSIIASSQYTTALQEPLVTMREGRYVIPVKATERRTLRGIVHDQSNTGATLFVEPLQTVELNNAWRELQIAEQQEIARILQALSAEVGEEGDRIIGGVEVLAELDLIFAKGRYSAALNAVEPLIDDQPAETPLVGDLPDTPVRLLSARHPLLDQQTVVPTDLWLGGDMSVLLITGPNTGGKTVALKTVGLLALMSQCGIHIPAEPGSRLPVFEGIFADIGDEQSIEQSLSTFSSHMSNIISILGQLQRGQLGPRALVLLDELGAGTDPTEGAALARAIVEQLLSFGSMVIATTHYAELKAFAYNTPGVENGSVTFDDETLRPTYVLEIGLPGRSNALAIASRLGLDPALVDRARSFLSAETEQVEQLLGAIAGERDAIAAERQRAEELRIDAEKVRDQLQRELDTAAAERQGRLEAFERELEEELRGARQELRRLRDDTRSVSLTREWLQQAEERLNAVGVRVAEGRRERAAPQPQPQQQPRLLQAGDRVHVLSVNLDGEVLDVDEQTGEVDVQVGGFRMRVDARELRRGKSGGPVNVPSPRPISTPIARDVSMQLDLRGRRAHEIPDLLDRYINDAYLADLSDVRIIHGKGTGTLRKIVRDALAAHPLVKSVAAGIDGEGGEGVTTAKLTRR
jgi:DNA mismatch repair protein MutS2